MAVYDTLVQTTFCTNYHEIKRNRIRVKRGVEWNRKQETAYVCATGLMVIELYRTPTEKTINRYTCFAQSVAF